MTKKKSNTHHITYDKNEKHWEVKRGGSHRATSTHKTKKEAIDAGREVSRNQNTELKIHNMDGEIAQSDSHGKDPFPPRG